MSDGRIYLDHAATTPLLPAAREAMAEALARWHNPSSPHAEGRAAKAALEDARTRIAAALGWPGHVVFTSGATEALTIALKNARAGGRYVSAVEHDAVLRAVPDATVIPVDGNGFVDPVVVQNYLEGDRPLLAIQHANNETGVEQAIDVYAYSPRPLILVDCAQTAGKFDITHYGYADMIAISGHKFGGPPGTGALLIKDFADLEAIGGQEQGYRPGTENVPAVIAMAVALEAGNEWVSDAARLRRQLEDILLAAGGEVVAADEPRIPTIGAYRMPGVPSAAQLIQFDLAGIAVSAGSACSSGSLKPSRVLMAMGWDEASAGEVVRVSFGRETTESDVDRFIDEWIRIAKSRRAA